MDEQSKKLFVERDQLAKLVGERGREIELLKQARAKLEEEKSTLTAHQNTLGKQLADSRRELEALKKACTQWQAEKSSMILDGERFERLLQDRQIESLRKDSEYQLLLTNFHQLQEDVEQLLDAQGHLELAKSQLELEIQRRDADRVEQFRVAAERDRATEVLAQMKVQLEHEVHALTIEREVQTRVGEARDREIDDLKQTKARLEQERHTLAVERDVQVLAAKTYDRDLNVLKQDLAELKRERRDLIVERDQQSRVLATRERELELLQQANAMLEQGKKTLVGDGEAKLRSAEARDRELEALRQVTEKLEQEKQAFAENVEEQSKALLERDRELEVLKQELAKLEQELQVLAADADEKSKKIDARNQELEELKQETVKLEQEKQALTVNCEANAARVETRDRELETLARTNARLEQEMTAIITRNRISAKRGSKGDSDIDDLIFDLELFFSGKAIVYVDVGSYVGDVFLKLNQTAKSFRIHEAHLYEPNPASYARLLEKTSGEHGATVHTYNFAIGESTDTSQFISAKSMTKALSGDLADMGTSGDVFTARRTNLDSQSSIFTDGKINLLKIDVEGHELDVLAGARGLLATQSVDILYVEVGFNLSGTQQTYFAEIDRFMQSLNYRVLRIYEQKEEWMSGSPLLRRANIAYMSEKFANAHPLKLMQEMQDLKNKLHELTGSEIGR